MEKEHEELILPDEYGSIMGGNADTSSDAHFGDFIYAQEKVGNTTRMTRRAILTDQITPDPFPENIADPKSDPDRYGIMEDPMNGTMRVDPNMLPPLQKKLDEAEAILKGCSSKNKDKESIDQNKEVVEERQI